MIGAARSFSVVLFAALVACEGVPDLRFDDGVDASSLGASPASVDDASGGAVGLGSGQPAEAGSGEGGGGSSDNGGGSGDNGGDDASATPATAPSDASPATLAADAAPAGCPGQAPPGVFCCGSVECVGDIHKCNCFACATCENKGGVCCPIGIGAACVNSVDKCGH